MAKVWFRNKRYGLGYAPASWQGWLATAMVVALAVLDVRLTHSFFADPVAGRQATVAGLVVLVIGYFLLTVSRCDGPMRWRWGDDDQHPLR
jgi:hypothetical protein